MLLDLLSQIEPDDSWRPQLPDPVAKPSGLSAAILAGAFFFCPLTLGTASTAAQGGLAQVFPGRSVQYQSQTAPFYAALPVVTPTIDGWGPDYPSWFPAPRLPTLSALTEPRARIDFNWEPAYPDAIDRRVMLSAQQQALAFSPAPEHTIALAWQGRYPDAIDRRILPVSAHPAFVTSPYPEQTIARAWAPVYPDRIPREIVRAVDQLAFVTGTTSSVIPITDLRWQAHYPDRLDPPPRVAEFRSFFFDPYPRPADTQSLGWLPLYPDVLFRAGFPTHLQLAAFTPTYLPLSDLRWQGVFPDRIAPTSGLAVYLQRAFWLDPFPPAAPTVPSLVWLPGYPDLILRPTMIVAHQVAWWSVASTLIWSGPIPTPCPPCPDGGAADASVIIGRGW